MYYITHYSIEDYYNPAEGGYSYEGYSVIEYAETTNKKAAVKCLKRESKRLHCKRHSKRYSEGEGEFIVIENTLGERECGYRCYE